MTVPAVSITLSPLSANVQPGGTQQFTATVSGTVNTQVTYSALNGTVNPTGLYTAPASSGNDTVTATAAATPNPQSSVPVSRFRIRTKRELRQHFELDEFSCEVASVGKTQTRRS